MHPLIEKIRKKIETDPYPVTLTKMEWAQIIGLCLECKDKGITDSSDIRFQAAVKLGQLCGIELDG